jgi:hypothetical protein
MRANATVIVLEQAEQTAADIGAAATVGCWTRNKLQDLCFVFAVG